MTEKPKPPRWTEKLVHPTVVVEPCPNPECGFPEADGGYCPECGWQRYVPGCPHCKKEKSK